MKNLFGTDGIRGTVGTAPFTSEQIPLIGEAIGRWLTESYSAPITLFLAHDTRESCGWIKEALTTSLRNFSITVIDAGVLPTPVVLQQVRLHNYSCGLVISASHNPYQDNGIKIMNAAGKISAADELRISELYGSADCKDFRREDGSYESVRGECPPKLSAKADVSHHTDEYIKQFPPNFLLNKKIVLDCANGATYQLAPALFRHFGAEVVAINAEPNGTNINEQCGALHLQSLQQAVLAHQADLGFAFDGDGDRVIAVNRAGEIKDGDDLMAVLLDHPTYAATDTVVGTIMSNRGFELWLATRGKKLIRANVGDKYVAEQLETNNLPMGGEPSGHVILRDYLPTGDGIFCALRVAHTAQLTGNWDLHSFTKFPQVMINVRVKERKDLKTEPLAGLIEQAEAALGQGRLVIRYSGTEPLLRIMAEAPEHEVALHSVQRLSEQIRQLL